MGRATKFLNYCIYFSYRTDFISLDNDSGTVLEGRQGEQQKLMSSLKNLSTIILWRTVIAGKTIVVKSSNFADRQCPHANYNFLEDATSRVIAGKTIAVKSNNFAKRQRSHGNCTEWVGVYQNEEVLVSEWNFKFTLERQKNKKEPDFREFIK